MKKFWNFVRDEEGERVLRLEGPIDAESFWGDEITPQDFRDELYAEDGDITLWVNSPGGNVFAAAEIYTMIRDYPHNVTVKIASIAASAASVVAMAGDTVQMSPTSLLMIHDPSTIAVGNAKDMEKAISTLNEVKESIINAYAAKTGLSRNRISKLMSDETWINAKKAVELGFADEILFDEKKPALEPEKEDPAPEDDKPDEEGGEPDEEKKDEKPVKLAADWAYSTRIMGQTILDKIGASAEAEGADDTPDDETPPQEPAEEGLKTAPTVSVPDMPVIGLDGRTADGSMPYEILKRQLAFMR
jgi:ATP-dependent Clp protease protease subunit